MIRASESRESGGTSRVKALARVGVVSIRSRDGVEMKYEIGNQLQ